MILTACFCINNSVDLEMFPQTAILTAMNKSAQRYITTQIIYMIDKNIIEVLRSD